MSHHEPSWSRHESSWIEYKSTIVHEYKNTRVLQHYLEAIMSRHELPWDVTKPPWAVMKLSWIIISCHEAIMRRHKQQHQKNYNDASEGNNNNPVQTSSNQLKLAPKGRIINVTHESSKEDTANSHHLRSNYSRHFPHYPLRYVS